MCSRCDTLVCTIWYCQNIVLIHSITIISKQQIASGISAAQTPFDTSIGRVLNVDSQAPSYTVQAVKRCGVEHGLRLLVTIQYYIGVEGNCRSCDLLDYLEVKPCTVLAGICLTWSCCSTGIHLLLSFQVAGCRDLY